MPPILYKSHCSYVTIGLVKLRSLTHRRNDFILLLWQYPIAVGIKVMIPALTPNESCSPRCSYILSIPLFAVDSCHFSSVVVLVVKMISHSLLHLLSFRFFLV